MSASGPDLDPKEEMEIVKKALKNFEEAEKKLSNLLEGYPQSFNSKKEEFEKEAGKTPIGQQQPISFDNFNILMKMDAEHTKEVTELTKIRDEAAEVYRVISKAGASPKEVAADLKLEAAKLFSKITPEMMILNAETPEQKKKDVEALQPVMDCIAQFNRLSNGVSSDILHNSNSNKDLVDKLKFHVALAMACVKSGDYFSANAIQTGLKDTSVQRLMAAPEIKALDQLVKHVGVLDTLFKANISTRNFDTLPKPENSTDKIFPITTTAAKMARKVETFSGLLEDKKPSKEVREDTMMEVFNKELKGTINYAQKFSEQNKEMSNKTGIQSDFNNIEKQRNARVDARIAEKKPEDSKLIANPLSSPPILSTNRGELESKINYAKSVEILPRGGVVLNATPSVTKSAPAQLEGGLKRSSAMLFSEGKKSARSRSNVVFEKPTPTPTRERSDAAPPKPDASVPRKPSK